MSNPQNESVRLSFTFHDDKRLANVRKRGRETGWIVTRFKRFQSLWYFSCRAKLYVTQFLLQHFFDLYKLCYSLFFSFSFQRRLMSGKIYIFTLFYCFFFRIHLFLSCVFSIDSLTLFSTLAAAAQRAPSVPIFRSKRYEPLHVIHVNSRLITADRRAGEWKRAKHASCLVIMMCRRVKTVFLYRI